MITVVLNVLNLSHTDIKNKYEKYFGSLEIRDCHQVSDNYYTNVFISTYRILKEFKSSDIRIINSNVEINEKAYNIYSDNIKFYDDNYDIDILFLGGYRNGGYKGVLASDRLIKIESGYTAYGIFELRKGTVKHILKYLNNENYILTGGIIDKYPGFDLYLLDLCKTLNAFTVEPRLWNELPLIENKSYAPYQENKIYKFKEFRQFGKYKGDRCYTFFIELTPYYMWQAELLIYSLLNNAKIKKEDIVLLFSSDIPDQHIQSNKNYKKMISMIEKYGIKYFSVENIGKLPWTYRIENKNITRRQYPVINKWTSMAEASINGIYNDWDEIVVLEQDLWCSGSFPYLPDGNCYTDNWINNKTDAFLRHDPDYNGINILELLKFIGTPDSNIQKFNTGSIIFKLTKDVFNNTKFWKSVIDFTQLLISITELNHPTGLVYEIEMVSPSISLAYCGYDVYLDTSEELSSENWTNAKEDPINMVVHYGWDFANYSHLGTDFGKGKFNQDEKPWDNKQRVKEWIIKSKRNWERRFFEDMLNL